MVPPSKSYSGEKRSPMPFVPASGCTVTTIEMATESELAIRSFQKVHPSTPVYVIADTGAAEHLKRLKMPNVFITEAAFNKPAVKEHNSYHRSDAILKKMDALAYAVGRWGDSAFFDSDLVFVEPLSGPEDSEVALSQNHTTLEQEEDALKFGWFNAGLVWTCNAKFPEWWRQNYLNNDGFYEQKGLNDAPRYFRTGYFDYGHNYGFWRGPINKRRPKSLHLHMAMGVDAKLLPFMRPQVYRMRAEAWRYFHNFYPDLGKQARRIVGHPEKVWFIHYGKSAGVTANKLIHDQILPDYEFHDSWAEGKQRDFNETELENILRFCDEDKCHHLHQHHTSVTSKQLALARERGWKTALFVRTPVELIPALHKAYLASGKDRSPMTLSEFWQVAIRKENRHEWKLPAWLDSVDVVDLFSNEALHRVCVGWFGYGHSNPTKEVAMDIGLQRLREAGHVGGAFIDELTATPEYQAFSTLFKGRV